MCQLKCPLCPVGTQKLGHDRKVMSFETFKVILDKMPFIRTVELYRSGEPFLNPAICAMTRYASDRKIRVIISTHFSFSRPDEFFEKLVTSGLDRLVLSLDGASQESYSQYRVGGDYNLVMSNIRNLLEVKSRLHSSTPEIVWQFLVNKFNEHEIPLAQKISREMGIKLDLRPIGLADDVPDVELDGTIEERKAKWLPSSDKYVSDCYKGAYRYPLLRGACTQLFTRLVVTVDGKVLPCCEVWDESSVFGDLLSESFDEIWYSRKYTDARSRFLKSDFKPHVDSVCFRCNNFGAGLALRDKVKLMLVVCRTNVGHWVRSFF